MNYAELQTQIVAYMHNTAITDRVPTFIAIAEALLFRELDIKEMQISTVLTTVGEYANLPADFGSLSKLTVDSGGIVSTLDYYGAPEVYVSPTARPTHYAFEQGKLRIFGAGTGQQATLLYTPKIKPLSNTNTTNWLLENAPDLYLYASALEAAKYVRDEVQAANLGGLVPTLLEAVKRYAQRKGTPSVGSLQIKVRR